MAVHYAEQLRRNARRRPSALAVVDHGRESTYSELDQKVDNLAGSLVDLGVAHGDRIALIVDNDGVPLEVMLACCRVGAVYVPLDFRLSARDAGAILADADPVAVVFDDPYRDIVDEVRPSLPGVIAWVSTAEDVDSSMVSYRDLITGPTAQATMPTVIDADLFCILYTSGTTGRAKGVTFTHSQAYDNAVAVVVACGLGPDSRYLVSYPHNSAGTVNHVWGPTLVTGGCIVLGSVKDFNAPAYFTLIQDHRVTHSQIVPTMLFRLLDFDGRENYDFSSLQSIGYASAPIPGNRVRQAIEAFGPVLSQMYGMRKSVV